METCPICDSGSLTETIIDYATHYRGSDGVVRDLLVPNVRVTRCGECGEEMLGADAMAQIENAQRVAMGRLSPNELRTWRENLGKTQTQMSLVLGFGKKTLARWETGAYTLPASADRYIRLMMLRPDNFACVERLSQEVVDVLLISEPDDLAEFDFPSLTEEFRSFFDADDPAVKSSRVFSLELSQGRVFAL